jgi:hypothetical protein
MAEEEEVKRAFIEGICQECSITPAMLQEILGNPEKPVKGFSSDWWRYVPAEIISAWEILSADALVIAFYMAVLTERMSVEWATANDPPGEE